MRDDLKSHGLWERTAPPAPSTQPLQRALRADIAVIGAGFTGLSTALHLAEAGANVVVLESVAPGFGGSGRNVGLVNAGMWLPPDDVCHAIGDDHGEQLLQVLGGAPALVFDLIEKYGIACEAVRNGTLHCASDGAGMRDLDRRATQWRRRGAPVMLLDAEETQRRLGTDVYKACLLDQRAGTVQPLAYARGLAHAAVRAGAQIFTQSEVLAAERQRTTWMLRTAAGAVEADWVVVATNAYSGKLWPQLRSEFVRLPFYQCATAPLDAASLRTILPGKEGTWDTRTVMRSLRLDASGRLIFGSIGSLQSGTNALHVSFARRTLHRMYPTLTHVRFEHEWFGWIAMTEDNLPRYHELAPNVISFNGYNGRGIGTGTMFGKLLATRILRERGGLADGLANMSASGQASAMPLPPVEAAPVAMRSVKGVAYEVGAAMAHLV